MRRERSPGVQQAAGVRQGRFRCKRFFGDRFDAR